MNKKYAISDIHGCSKTLNALMFEKLKIDKSDELYFIGDFIDRGPDSKSVLETLMSMNENGYKASFIRGNHEQMFLDSIQSISDMELWVLNGCDATLSSFNVFHPNEVPENYIKFLEQLPYYIETENFILVHGGLNFDADCPLEDYQAMLWMRNTKVIKEKINNKRIIVGHTPKSIDEINDSLLKDRIIIDGGCCYSRRYSTLGKLIALDLDTLEIYYQDNIELY